MSEMGHERHFKRKSRTSAFPPIADIVAASHRLASCRSDPRRGKADRGEHCHAAGAAAQGLTSCGRARCGGSHASFDNFPSIYRPRRWGVTIE
jgi:hypothetical protein